MYEKKDNNTTHCFKNNNTLEFEFYETREN